MQYKEQYIITKEQKQTVAAVKVLFQENSTKKNARKKEISKEKIIRVIYKRYIIKIHRKQFIYTGSVNNMDDFFC